MARSLWIEIRVVYQPIFKLTARKGRDILYNKLDDNYTMKYV